MLLRIASFVSCCPYRMSLCPIRYSISKSDSPCPCIPLWRECAHAFDEHPRLPYLYLYTRKINEANLTRKTLYGTVKRTEQRMSKMKIDLLPLRVRLTLPGRKKDRSERNQHEKTDAAAAGLEEMDQSASLNGREIGKNRSTAEISIDPIEDRRSCYYQLAEEDGEDAVADADADADDVDCPDLISDLPDECLAHIFQSLGSGDRKCCSLVCRRWLRVEGQSRHRLSLDARSDLQNSIPSIFSRFDSVSKLALKSGRRSVSIGDEALALISVNCRNLARLKIRACREITDVGMAELARNCRNLKKLSCDSCAFGARGIKAFLDHEVGLEELSVKRLRGLTDDASMEPFRLGPAALSLKIISLKEIYNAQCFEPIIVGAKNLKTLKLFRCSGDWDRLLESVAVDRVAGLREIHLERLQVSDCGLAAISNCLDLEILHLVKTPECTNAGLMSIADRCKLLRKLHIDGWKTNRIGDEGLAAIARRCPNLQELVLIGVNPTSLSLGLLTSNCRNLQRLALCSSETIGDAELSCIAAKCVALRKLCIKGCPVSDQGMEALAGGCPNLVKVKVKKCRGVTSKGAEWLRANRESLAVNLDIGEVEPQDASASEGGGAQENGGEQYPPVIEKAADADLPSGSKRRSAFSKAKMGFLTGRNFVACTFRRWSHKNSNPNNT